jgi:Putative zinc-finger
MDHRYIDEHSVAERYVGNALPPEERAVFEAHLVDCQECTDRLLLAGMFHARQKNGVGPHPPAGLVMRFKPWQVLAIFAIAVLLLLSIPILLIPLWETFRR